MRDYYITLNIAYVDDRVAFALVNSNINNHVSSILDLMLCS